MGQIPEGCSLLGGSMSMIFKATLPHSKKCPPQVCRGLEKISMWRGEERMTLTTWGSVREAPSGGVTWHARVDLSLVNRYGSTYSSAGGCGYCKESAATICALRQLLADIPADMPPQGSGMSSLLSWLRQQGWRTAEDILRDVDRAQ